MAMICPPALTGRRCEWHTPGPANVTVHDGSEDKWPPEQSQRTHDARDTGAVLHGTHYCSGQVLASYSCKRGEPLSF